MWNTSKSGWIFAGLFAAGAGGCSADDNVEKQNKSVAVEQRSTTPEMEDEPVYQGRAEFGKAARPEFPEAYRGNWELERGQCTADNDATIVRVDRQGYRMGDGIMLIKELYLANGDNKRLIIDAVYSGGGEDVEQTVVVQMSDDKSEFRVWHKGEPEASGRTFYRCLGPNVSQHSAALEKADIPVYQGRAVFEQAARPELPKMFHGNWETKRGQCAADNDAMIVRADRQGYRGGDGAMSIKRIYLAPGDQKRLIIDAVYSGGGENVEQTVIVQMSDDKSRFQVWNKGESETSATIFYRCTRSRD